MSILCIEPHTNVAIWEEWLLQTPDVDVNVRCNVEVNAILFLFCLRRCLGQIKMNILFDIGQSLIGSSAKLNALDVTSSKRSMGGS